MAFRWLKALFMLALARDISSNENCILLLSFCKFPALFESFVRKSVVSTARSTACWTFPSLFSSPARSCGVRERRWSSLGYCVALMVFSHNVSPFIFEHDLGFFLHSLALPVNGSIGGSFAGILSLTNNRSSPVLIGAFAIGGKTVWTVVAFGPLLECARKVENPWASEALAGDLVLLVCLPSGSTHGAPLQEICPNLLSWFSAGNSWNRELAIGRDLELSELSVLRRRISSASLSSR